jgi:hypothetical protein
MTFAYVAFTMGMCYHVSDTTSRNRQIRRTPLSQALLSYPFGWGDRRRLGQSHRLPDSRNPCGERMRVFVDRAGF